MVDVVLDRDREDALVHEGADGVLDQPLLVAELEVHAGESTVPPPTARRYQNELVHQAPISAAKRSAPASGSAQAGNRCMRTISTLVANAPKKATPKNEWTAIRVS